MDKNWVEAEKAKYKNEASAKRAEIVGKVNEAGFLTEKDRRSVIDALDDMSMRSWSSFVSQSILRVARNHKDDKGEDTYDFQEMMNFMDTLITDAISYDTLFHRANTWLDRYLDSEPVEFDGDIIITDPCYIIRDSCNNDWRKCDYGDNMEVLGISTYMTRDTLYGDWGCTVYDTDTKEAIGSFCADAGLVSVFLLDEVLKYNPGFDYHKERDWTTTLIPDFKGTVQFVVEHEEGVYEEDSDYWRAGDKWEDYSVHVVGHGINKKTGEPINFHSTQTGL